MCVRRSQRRPQMCMVSWARCSIEDLPVVEAGPEHLHRPPWVAAIGTNRRTPVEGPGKNVLFRSTSADSHGARSMVRQQLGRWGRLAHVLAAANAEAAVIGAMHTLPDSVRRSGLPKRI